MLLNVIIPVVPAKGTALPIVVCKIVPRVKLPGETAYIPAKLAYKRNPANDAIIYVDGKPVTEIQEFSESFSLSIPDGSGIKLDMTWSNPNYEFLGWDTAGAIGESFILDNLYGSQNVEVLYDINGTVKVTAQSSASSMGVVMGGGVVPTGSHISFHALAKKGYSFVGWSDGATDNPRDVVASADNNFTAIFSQGGDVQTCTIVAKSEDTTQGVAAGSGTYLIDSTASVVGVPADGYAFSGWYDESDTLISNDQKYDVPLVADTTITLIAKFVEAPAPVAETVTVTCVFDSTYKYIMDIRGGGTYTKGETVYLTLNVYSDIGIRSFNFARIKRWYYINEEGEEVTLGSAYITSFTVTKDITVYCELCWALNIEVSQATKGQVYAYSSCIVSPSAELQLYALPKSNYELNKWILYQVSSQETIEFTDNPLSIPPALDGMYYLVPDWKAASLNYQVQAVVDGTHGVLQGAGTYASGDTVTIKASAFPGYTATVYVDDVEVPAATTESGFSFTMPSNNVVVKAIFNTGYTGTVDAEGLAAIGWLESDIAYLQEHVNWMAEDDDFYKVLDEEKTWFASNATEVETGAGTIKGVKYAPSETYWKYVPKLIYVSGSFSLICNSAVACPKIEAATTVSEGAVSLTMNSVLYFPQMDSKLTITGYYSTNIIHSIYATKEEVAEFVSHRGTSAAVGLTVTGAWRAESLEYLFANWKLLPSTSSSSYRLKLNYANVVGDTVLDLSHWPSSATLGSTIVNTIFSKNLTLKLCDNNPSISGMLVSATVYGGLIIDAKNGVSFSNASWSNVSAAWIKMRITGAFGSSCLTMDGVSPSYTIMDIYYSGDSATFTVAPVSGTRFPTTIIVINHSESNYIILNGTGTRWIHELRLYGAFMDISTSNWMTTSVKRIVVPSDLVSTYKEATNWSNASYVIVAGDYDSSYLPEYFDN